MLKNVIVCNTAICNGRTNPTGACNQVQEVMTKPDPFSLQYPEGKCISPERCVNCSKYFFNDGPRCTRKHFLDVKEGV